MLGRRSIPLFGGLKPKKADSSISRSKVDAAEPISPPSPQNYYRLISNRSPDYFRFDPIRNRTSLINKYDLINKKRKPRRSLTGSFDAKVLSESKWRLKFILLTSLRSKAFHTKNLNRLELKEDTESSPDQSRRVVCCGEPTITVSGVKETLKNR